MGKGAGVCKCWGKRKGKGKGKGMGKGKGEGKRQVKCTGFRLFGTRLGDVDMGLGACGLPLFVFHVLKLELSLVSAGPLGDGPIPCFLLQPCFLHFS